MGRLKKYSTSEEKKEANKLAAKKYYWKNKEACDIQSRIKYQKKIGKNIITLNGNINYDKN